MKKIQKQLHTQVKAIDDDNRRITFVMSSESVDRDGDIIRQAGWDLEAFKKNPVFLVFHDQRQFPIGKVETIGVESDRLIGTVKFADRGTYETADVAYELYKQGIMNAVSVSFAAKEYEPLEGGGLEIKSQELYELSAVPVPANPEAVAVASKAMGLMTDATGDATAPDEATEVIEKLNAVLEDAIKKLEANHE